MTTRNIVVHNTRQSTINYEISDANYQPGARILASGNSLATDGREPQTVTTYSDAPGDTSYYYRYLRYDDNAGWRSWTGGSTANGVLDII